MASRFRGYNIIFSLLMSMVWSTATMAQSSQDVERHVKAAYIYQFTKLIKWPSKSGDFVIYVVEDEELMSVLSDVVRDRLVESRKIRVQSAKWSEVVLNPGDIVVFPKNESTFHKQVIKKLKDKPCLLITFGEGLGLAGASINFFIKDDKIKFELNISSMSVQALVADQILVNLAKVIK